MKKLFTLIALCALTLSANAVYRYNCGITSIKVDTLQSTTKNQFTVTFEQKCKNVNEYTSKPEKYYTSTVKLVLNSDDRTLDGVYTTEGASTTSSSANKNDQTINLITSELTTSDNKSRVLSQLDGYTSTFVINKIDDSHYSIGECTLYFTERVNKTNTWIYQYSFDADHILEQGIEQTPFAFDWEAGYFTQFCNYDMTVTGVSVIRDDTDYDAKRYFMTLTGSGVNREDNTSRNYEIELAIYPTGSTISGNFATQGSQNILMAMDSYVKDLKINKQYKLANDSLSSILIESKGNNKYRFYGGTIICEEPDANYSAVYGKKRLKAVHYFHFSDEGTEFGFDESNTNIALTGSDIDLTESPDGYELYLNAKDDNNLNYIVDIVLDAENIAGTHKYGETLSAWSKVERGSSEFESEAGSTAYITHKSGNTYTVSATIISGDYTFVLAPFDFTLSSGATGIESHQHSAISIQKIFRDGQLIIIRDGKEYNALGHQLVL